ncbi:MAG: RluA family pseudouridine synthase [Planctomycetes bacterium]|nr:RluA family pseudouridine synthase [Planctomycetota bacterium]
MTKTERQAKIAIHKHEAGARLDAWLSGRFTYHALDEWVTLIQTKRLLVNDLPSQADYVLCAGDVIAYHPVSLAEPEVSRDIRVLFEDEFILAINKPADLPCHPAGRYFKNTVLTILRETRPEIRLINRLDRETSGVMLIAKNKRTAGKLGKQFERRQVTKEYQVVVEGEFPDQLTANGILTVDNHSPVIKKRLFQWEGEGETSHTEFRRMAYGSGLSLVHVTLGTGRMHQIRATLSALGYPVVGDKIYGLDETIFVRLVRGEVTDLDRTKLRLPHQALHAWRLTVRHPVSQEDMTFEAPLPRDVQQLLKDNGM